MCNKNTKNCNYIYYVWVFFLFYSWILKVSLLGCCFFIFSIHPFMETEPKESIEKSSALNSLFPIKSWQVFYFHIESLSIFPFISLFKSVDILWRIKLNNDNNMKQKVLHHKYFRIQLSIILLIHQSNEDIFLCIDWTLIDKIIWSIREWFYYLQRDQNIPSFYAVSHLSIPKV